MFCMECGEKNGQDHAYCIHCGVAIPHHTVKTDHDPAAKVQRPRGRQKAAAIAAGVLMAFFAAVFVLTGRNPATLPGLLILFVPLMLGATIFLAQVEKPVSWVEGLHSWTVRKGGSDAGRSGFIETWLLGPLVFGLSKGVEWPESIHDPYLRTGIQICASFYFIGILLYIPVGISIAVVLSGIALCITVYALGWKGRDPVKTASCSDRPKGREIHHSVFQKCADCSNYGKQDWSANSVCNLGRQTPDSGDTAACNCYKERQESGK